jgi:hypothetical protein
MPILSLTDVDAAYFALLGNDSLLLSYLNGRIWGEEAPQGTAFPYVRYWNQSPGSDTLSQGGLERVLSNPMHVVCVVDCQRGDQIDFLGGTTGHMADATKRLYALLHGQSFSLNGFNFQLVCKKDYRMKEFASEGRYYVSSGYWVQAYVN